MANITETANLCGLKRENFQTTINGKKTDLYFLRNRKGYEVAISNYGGAICAIMVPGKDGKVANVIQGHDSIQQLTSGKEPYLSTLIGRWGNRICKGQFILNGKEYQLALNDGPNPCMVVRKDSMPRYGKLVRWVLARWLCIASLLMVKRVIQVSWMLP